MTFSYTVKTEKKIDVAIQDLSSNLKEIGFGILGTLDFKDIFQKKGIEYDNEYKLLEVCNPQVAKQALDSDPDVGLLLPCTISVYTKDGHNYIGLAKPSALLSLSLKSDLLEMGKEIENKLIQTIDKSK
jgi:uncharacterized protein (DUF302 family)